MSSAGTFPFFLFTLPAGALADLADRRQLLRIFNGWLACSAGLMACCALLGGLTREVILAGVFLLGTGFAFQAPVASASIPEIVGKEQLPSAIARGGIQMNLAGIIGPALGGLLIPFGWRKHSVCHECDGVRPGVGRRSHLERQEHRRRSTAGGLFRFIDRRSAVHAVCARSSDRSAAKSHLRCGDRSNPSSAAGGWSEDPSSGLIKVRLGLYRHGNWIVGGRHPRTRAREEEA